MSLGFLTESALVPSKAKKIKVDAKSLVDLKAVVFQKDQERKRRLQDALIAENDDDTSIGRKAFRLGKYAHLRKRHKRTEEDRVGRNHRNSGVEDRCRRDEDEKIREAPDKDDDAAWSKKSAEALRKKAKLYEEMASGRGSDYLKDLKGECLVDFEAKRSMMNTGETTTVEITDEFGRTRSVLADSEDYVTSLETQQMFQKVSHGEKKRFDESENRHEEGKADRGSFVVSQWEKCLKNTEKTHLKEVHERATLAQSLAQPSLTSAGQKKTRKQLRLERLRKQQKEVATSNESTVPANAAFDSAASEKATNFLSHLSSLM